MLFKLSFPEHINQTKSCENSTENNENEEDSEKCYLLNDFTIEGYYIDKIDRTGW